MSALDALISIFLLASALAGYRRGLFREVLVTALWVPTLLGIGFVVTHSVSAAEGVDTQNLGLLTTIGTLYSMGVLTVWAVDKSLIQPRFQGTLQGTSRLFYKLSGLGVALWRGWWMLVAGLALYSAYLGRPDDDITRHGLYLPALTRPAIDVQNWLENNGYIQHETLVYTEEVYTYQSEMDDAKDLLKNSFTRKWQNNENTE